MVKQHSTVRMERVLFIHQLMDIWVASTFSLLWIVFPWTVMWQFKVHQWMPGAGEVGVWGATASGHGVSFWADKKVLQLHIGGGCITSWIVNITELYYKMAEMVNFMLRVFHNFKNRTKLVNTLVSGLRSLVKPWQVDNKTGRREQTLWWVQPAFPKHHWFPEFLGFLLLESLASFLYFRASTCQYISRMVAQQPRSVLWLWDLTGLSQSQWLRNKSL